MDHDSPPDDGRSRRNRIMKKFFHKEQKPGGTQQSDLDDFLHTSADTLEVSHSRPPPPSAVPPPPGTRVRPKLNISNATRYPQALNISQSTQALPVRQPINSPARRPQPNRKGMLVRFVDSWPDVIGEGGDECPEPTVEVSRRKKLRPPQPSPRPAPVSTGSLDDKFEARRSMDGYSTQPPPQHLQIARSLTSRSPDRGDRSIITPGNATSSRFLDTSRSKDENRRSYIETHQARQRLDEGRAFAQAAKSNSSTPGSGEWEDRRHEEGQGQQAHHDSPVSINVQPMLDTKLDLYQSPSANNPQSPDSTSSSHYSQGSPPTRQGTLPIPLSAATHPLSSRPSSRQNSGINQPDKPPPPAPRQPAPNTNDVVPSPGNLSRQGTLGVPGSAAPQPPSPLLRQNTLSQGFSRQQSFNLSDVVQAAGDDALDTFADRTKHLFELFRLHAETVRPISSSAPDGLARAALWWFIKGRMGLEMVIRSREGSQQSQMQLEMDRQQAYANLAKGYWISERAIPEILEARNIGTTPDIDESRRALLSNLRKLAMSMKRNGLLPPEEAFLPQTIDKSIWVEYPNLSQDVVALLTGAAGSGMTMVQRTSPQLSILESLPLGDVSEYFNYSRIAVDAYLMEQGMESQRVTLPCLMSTVRPQNQPNLVFILTSQSGQVQLRITGNKNLGPTWDDVRWVPEANVLDIRLPRGFKLDVHCSRQDFGMLWNMYDFGRKVQSTLYPRPDEQVLFRSTLPAFEYLDADPQSRVFPKDTQPNCEVALFEKIFKEPVAGGTRSLHRGCRIAVVTGPQTRTLSGVNHAYIPTQPVQFTFLRDNNQLPALHLRFDTGRQKGHMVLSFKDDKERMEFHMLFTGASVRGDELVVAKVPLAGFQVTQRLRSTESMGGLEKLPWSVAKIVNEETGDDDAPTVLSDRMRVWVDFNYGTVTDRMNMAPGELRVRLEVGNDKVLHVLRQPQQDITMALSESHVSKEATGDVARCLQVLGKSPSVRSYTFKTKADLHAFQRGLTGYQVVFDAVATAFSIARRRMVVPIHKKWEAGRTRVQLVRQGDRAMQLLVFFEDFSHGHCMGFVLKGTDVFETFGRSSKAGLRLVDAKFPLPKMVDEGKGGGGGGVGSDEVAFVCLDLPEIPGEHDDISILFETEADRDELCQLLPAPVKGSSRLSRVK